MWLFLRTCYYSAVLTSFDNKNIFYIFRDAQIAKAFPKGIKCQKCLQLGHWSYECKEKRKYVHRVSRTKHLNKKIEEMKESETYNLYFLFVFIIEFKKIV